MKILIVDDEAAQSLEALKEQLLEAAPDNEADVRVAQDGEQALELAEEWRGVDLLISEIFMEPLNGFTLRNKIENRFPGVKTIFVTGYDVSGYAEYLEGCEVLQRPVDAQALLASVVRAAASGLSSSTLAEPEPEATPPSSTPEPQPQPARPITPLKPVHKPAAAAKPTALKPVTALKPANIQPPPVVPPDELVGQSIGSYRVVRKLGDGKWGPVYEAVQTSVDRPVALKILAPELEEDPESKKQFVANASAKANVDHPHILSVFEAGEAGGHSYYTHEFVEGDTLASLAAQHSTLDEPAALQVIKVVGEALAHLHENKIPHSPLEAGSIYIGKDKRTRLANLATVDDQFPDPHEEMRTLAEAILTVLPDGTTSDPGMGSMIARMFKTGAAAFPDWPTLLRILKTVEPKVVPVDAFKLSARDQKAIRAVEAARQRQKQQLLWSIAGAVVLLGIVGAAVYWKFLRQPEKPFESELVHIPTGEFIYQNGEKITLPDFWIDKYEVTLGQYAEFLDFLQKTPTTEFDNPQQPKGRDGKPKSHVPQDWDKYYGRASAADAKFHSVKNAPITVKCPVFMVDYWDAWAYAKWKKRRLPTEQEWEKAARGTDGHAYPWGDDWDEKKANTGGDYEEKPAPGYKPGVDGFVWWSPVDAVQTDRSPFGVIGMAGNVSEWTDTRDPSGKSVIVRGGSYKSGADDAKVTHRVLDVYPETAAESLGFRTVSDEAPPATGK